MQIIFGANGAAGRAYCQQFSHNNTLAVLRQAATDDFFEQQQIQTTIADALEQSAIDTALQPHSVQTVISFVGGKNEQGIRSDAVGNINIINATLKANPNARFIFITSMGCGEQYEQMSEQFKQFLGEAVRAKTEAENALRASSLRWTILRPCGLNNDDNAQFQLVEGKTQAPAQYMSRQGLAAAVAQILQDDSTIGQIYTVTA